MSFSMHATVRQARGNWRALAVLSMLGGQVLSAQTTRSVADKPKTDPVKLETVTIQAEGGTGTTIDTAKVPSEFRNPIRVIAQCTPQIREELANRMFPVGNQLTGECYWLQKGLAALQSAQLSTSGNGQTSGAVELLSQVVGPIRVALSEGLVSSGDGTPDALKHGQVQQLLSGGASTVLAFAIPMFYSRGERFSIPMGIEFHPTLRLGATIPKLGGGISQTYQVDTLPATAQLSVDGSVQAGPQGVQLYGFWRAGAGVNTAPIDAVINNSTKHAIGLANLGVGLRLFGAYSFLATRSWMGNGVLQGHWYLTIATMQK